MRNESVTDHYRYNASYPVNYTWPEKVSYENPIKAVKHAFVGGWWFQLQSGEQTGNDDQFEGVFQELNWVEIKSIVICYYFGADSSLINCLEFFNKENMPITKIGYPGNAKSMQVHLRQGERVVGIKAHKTRNHFYNFQLIIMGPC